jgi:hypothetical protein
MRGLSRGCAGFLLWAVLVRSFLGPVFFHLPHVFAFHEYRMPQLETKGESCWFADKVQRQIDG